MLVTQRALEIMRLYEGIPVNHFILIGFNADPMKTLPLAQKRWLAELGVTSLCLNVAGKPPLTSTSAETRVLTELPTGVGDEHVLPKWTASHGAPAFLIVRPDLYVYAGVPDSTTLVAAVGELLYAVKDPTPRASPEKPVGAIVAPRVAAAAAFVAAGAACGAYRQLTLTRSNTPS